MRRALGHMNSSETFDHPLNEVFVTVVGYEWEEFHTGDGDTFGSVDLFTAQEQADAESKERGDQFGGDLFLQKARAAARIFVRDYADQIRFVAAGLLLLCDSHGYLGDKRKQALVDWVRPQLPRSLTTLAL
jgi:hypothetical protein